MYDMGNIKDIVDIDNFITKDIKIVVAGSKAWEQSNVIEVFDKIKELNDVNFIFSFTDELLQKTVIKNMGKFKNKTYFSGYIPDPFYAIYNKDIYNKILEDVLINKIEKINTIRINECINFMKKQFFIKF